MSYYADDDLTPILCLACEGKYRKLYDAEDGRHMMIRCRWCNMGAMNQEQLRKYMEYCRERNIPY